MLHGVQLFLRHGKLHPQSLLFLGKGKVLCLLCRLHIDLHHLVLSESRQLSVVQSGSRRWHLDIVAAGFIEGVAESVLLVGLRLNGLSHQLSTDLHCHGLQLVLKFPFYRQLHRDAVCAQLHLRGHLGT